MEADYEITHFQGSIPELFCCKSLSEGFATIVVALGSSLRNRRGNILTREQLLAVVSCVARLNQELFLKYETALALIDELEDAGLNTDPSIASPIAELLLGEAHEPDADHC